MYLHKELSSIGMARLSVGLPGFKSGRCGGPWRQKFPTLNLVFFYIFFFWTLLALTEEAHMLISISHEVWSQKMWSLGVFITFMFFFVIHIVLTYILFPFLFQVVQHSIFVGKVVGSIITLDFSIMPGLTVKIYFPHVLLVSKIICLISKLFKCDFNTEV